MPAPYVMLLLTAIATALCAGLLLSEWRRNRGADSLLWWAVAAGLCATGYAAFALGGDTPDGWLRMLANYAMLGAAGLGYCAARRINGASPNLFALVLGPTIWLAASAKLGPDFASRVIVISLLHAAYSVLTAFELIRRINGRPVEFRAIAGLALAIAAIHAMRAIFGPTIVGVQSVDPAINGEWVMPMALAGLGHFTLLTVLVIRGFRKGGQLPDIAPPPTTGRARQMP